MKAILAISVLLFVSCAAQLAINEIPMYGNAVKANETIKADSIFIAQSISQHLTRDSASRFYSERGFYYLRQRNISTAIKRFNQAWLLDSTNKFAYWGMGIIISARDKNYEYSAKLFEIAKKYDNGDVEFLYDYGVSNMDVIENCNLNKLIIMEYREKAINAFKKVIEIGKDDYRKKCSRVYLEDLIKIN